MPLSSLPVELVDYVFEKAIESSPSCQLLNLSLVNRYTHKKVGRRLYRVVSLHTMRAFQAFALLVMSKPSIGTEVRHLWIGGRTFHAPIHLKHHGCFEDLPDSLMGQATRYVQTLMEELFMRCDELLSLGLHPRLVFCHTGFLRLPRKGPTLDLTIGHSLNLGCTLLRQVTTLHLWSPPHTASSYMPKLIDMPQLESVHLTRTSEPDWDACARKMLVTLLKDLQEKASLKSVHLSLLVKGSSASTIVQQPGLLTAAWRSLGGQLPNAKAIKRTDHMWKKWLERALLSETG